MPKTINFLLHMVYQFNIQFTISKKPTKMVMNLFVINQWPVKLI